MPASSQRYQSQLFNFIVQQSIKWTDRTAKAVRHLQVATVWGIQALLYPIYAVVQATRNTLGKSATAEAPQFAPTPETQTPNADAPIVTVLADIQRGELDAIADGAYPEFTAQTNTVAKWRSLVQWITSAIGRGAIVRVPENAEKAISISATQPPAKIANAQRNIRGIASLIDLQKFVLVDEANQILDILNSQQQQHLEQRIFVEIGNYWIARQPAELEPQSHKKPNRFLGWMQNSPVAKSLNWFQEATLAEGKNAAPEQTSPRFSIPVPSGSGVVLQPSTLPTLNRVNKATGERALSTAGSTPKVLNELHQFVAEKARSIRYPQPADPWQNQSDNLPHQTAQTDPAKSPQFSATNSPQKALPHGFELPDFYYHKVVEIVQTVNDSLQKKLARVAEQFVQIADPWFSGSEFVDRIDPATENSGANSGNVAAKKPLKLGNRTFKELPASGALERPLESLQTWAKDSRNRLAEWGIPGLEPSPDVAVETSSIAYNPVRESRVPDPVEARETFSNPFIWESSTLELANESESNWIDTEATSVEYIKHPLERILEWLDGVAFWIEKRLTQLWQSLQRFWQQKLHPNK